MTEAQTSNRLPLACEREAGKDRGTIIFRFSGPFTARTVFAVQSPDAIGHLFDLQTMLPDGELPAVNIFDLTAVPYMDSAGLGMVVRHYTRCKDKGVRFVAAGMSPRVLELFQLTKVDTVLPLIATVAEAEAV
ncbi:MAG TPA: STAS domain-containing protein [Acidobacteriaceae bacterium]|jgi:anti-anti-sigma factor